MQATNPARAFDARVTKAAAKLKHKAQARKAEVLAAPVVCRDVDRNRLASILAPLGYTVEASRLVMPEDLAHLKHLSLESLKFEAPISPYFEGAKVQPDEDENAAIRAQVDAATGYGRSELWGVRHRTSGGEDTHFFWATPAAVAVRYPDMYTRERRANAGVKGLSGVGAPLQIERLGVFAR